MKFIDLIAKENVGGLDLVVRSLVGSVSIVLLAMDKIPESRETLVGFIAFVGLFTAMARHCSPYALIGFSTKKEKTC